MWNSSYGQHKCEIGSLVQLQQNGPVYEVRWRGRVFEPMPTGQRRIAVYQLEGLHWDCYYEDELGPLFSSDALAYSPLWRK